MHAHRLSLLFVAALLGACGGSRSMPGGATGGSTGSGTGGDGAGGAPGTGGSGAGGGAGGSAPSGSGGTGGGAGGGAGRGGSGGAGGAGDAAVDMPRPADATPDSGGALDTAPLDSAGSADGPDFDAGAATCGGATCPKLFPRIDACKPAGACAQQTEGLVVRRCYANGVRIVGMVNPLTGSIVGTYFAGGGGTQCFTAEAPLIVAPGQMVVFRDPAGAEIGRAMQGAGTSTALTCDGETFNLADRSCLPAFTESECMPGVCP